MWFAIGVAGMCLVWLVDRDRGRYGAGDVFVGPMDHFDEDGAEFEAFIGEVVFVAGGIVLIGFGLDEAEALHAFEAVGEDVGGDVLGGIGELVVAGLAEPDHVADDEQGPFVADQIEGSADRAGRAHVR